jgi:Surface glycan-binding protein B xyloglucan binding domain
MKKLFYNVNTCLLLVVLAAMALTQTGCKKDKSSSTGAPVITAIRNYVAHPGDSLISKVGTGQWVVISGHNLKGALNVYFDGTLAAAFNDVWSSDTSAIAEIPSVIAFPIVPTKQLNTIRYVTTHGETTFSFPIVAPAPQITGISDEAAVAGDSVKILGLSFFFVKSVTYAGLPITNFTSSNDGTSISLAVPGGVTNTGGIVSVTTPSGTASTVYNVHDFVDGVFQNWDSINGYPWGSNTENSSTDFPGNTGYYNVITATNLSGYDNAWYNGGRGVNMNASQWVPTADIDSSLSSYAVKFEISIPKSTPFTGGSIYVAVNYGFDALKSYIARYRPWINSAGKTTAFSTTGWITVTVPLSTFLTNNGTGTPPASITDLLGSSGNTGMNVAYMNDAPTPVAAFTMAIDNIRVVKIK